MANTYHWKIVQLDAKIKENDLDNVIYTVHYRFYAEDDSDPKIVRDIIGCIGVEYDPDNFIPYEDLTKEDVVIKNPVDEYLKPDWD